MSNALIGAIQVMRDIKILLDRGILIQEEGGDRNIELPID